MTQTQGRLPLCLINPEVACGGCRSDRVTAADTQFVVVGCGRQRESKECMQWNQDAAAAATAAGHCYHQDPVGGNRGKTASKSWSKIWKWQIMQRGEAVKAGAETRRWLVTLRSGRITWVSALKAPVHSRLPLKCWPSSAGDISAPGRFSTSAPPYSPNKAGRCVSQAE